MAASWLRGRLRRWLGSYRVEDPRPIAAGAPYTFFLPSENELLAIEPGDLVKLTIQSIPAGDEWDAERMWVEVLRINGDVLIGKLANDPVDMPQLRPGSPIKFHRSYVIDIDWSAERSCAPPPAPPHRGYWERCLVDACILRGECSVDYIYREEPDMTHEGDRFPDSGWRVRASEEATLADQERDNAVQYVAVGAALNRDDSWLSWVDAPIGSAFIRNLETGDFEPCERDAPSE